MSGTRIATSEPLSSRNPIRSMPFASAPSTILGSSTNAAVTAMSITAQYLLTHKRIENWILWIAVDVLYAFWIFPTQHLYVSAVLYFVLLVLAAIGLVQWLGLEKKQRCPEPAPVA